MRLCAFWDCMEEVDEGMSFCREHARKLNLQLIDKCPRCGRYKDVRLKLCPDCNYGRPVAGWKISSRNLEEIDYQEIDKPKEEPPVLPVSRQSADLVPEERQVTRGEATCPSCGSFDLTYKKAFDYFKCNGCETTFITPVYSYGDSGAKAVEKRPAQQVNRTVKQEAPPPRRDYPQPARQEYTQPIRQEYVQPIRQEPPPVYREPAPPMYEPPPPPYREQLRTDRGQPPVYAEQAWASQPPRTWEEPAPRYVPPPAQQGKEPYLDFLRKGWGGEKHAGNQSHGAQGQKSKLGWVYLSILLSIIALAALLCWFLFNAQISEMLDTIL